MSELLGSFGDNELSPECLDGAQKFLKGMYVCVCYLCRLVAACRVRNVKLMIDVPSSEEGISIPYRYTSTLAPIMSSKLWNEAKVPQYAVAMSCMRGSYICPRKYVGSVCVCMCLCAVGSRLGI